jgi:type I restriction enzyme, S subunit
MKGMKDMDVKETVVGLPDGWRMVVLGDYCDKVSLNGIKIKQRDYLPFGKFPVVDQGQENIGGYYDDPSLVVPSEPPYIIFGDHTKVKKFINFKFIAGADGVKVLKPKASFDPHFFYYLIHTVKIPDKGYARHFQFLDKAKIPLPPLAEQERIVSKIEELFSELEKGKEQILLAQQQLKTYRQSVLKWAFEGRLTDDWRKIHQDQESGRDLLVRIKTARDQYAKITGRKIKIIPDVTLEEMLDVVELPESWTWTKLNEITYQITDGTHLKPTYMEKGMPFLSVKNVRPGLVRDEDIKYISREQHDDYVRRCKPEKGDILYTKVGATYGYAAINNLDYEFSIYVSLCLVKFPQESIYPRYLEHCMNSRLVYRQAQERIKGIGRPDLHLEEIRDFYVPICSFEEQHRIVQEIESRLSVCDAMEATLQTSLAQAEVLRQSVLKRAFEGRLV